MRYRLGWPLGRLAARIGVPILVRIDVIRDVEAGVYVGTSDDLAGLVIEAETFESLIEEAHDVIPNLLKGHEALLKDVVPSIRYTDHLAHA